MREFCGRLLTVVLVIVLISFSEDPIGINDFTYHDGTRTPPLRDWFQITEGDACIDVNIGSMNYAAAAEGKNATIQIQYSAGEGILYQVCGHSESVSGTVPHLSIVRRYCAVLCCQRCCTTLKLYLCQ